LRIFGKKAGKWRFLDSFHAGKCEWSEAICHQGKRWRATAPQNAGALADDERMRESVVECASPLALWGRAIGDDVRSL